MARYEPHLITSREGWALGFVNRMDRMVIHTSTPVHTRRSLTPVPVVALVGYTNAGKSTLLNTLTQASGVASGRSH